MVSRPCDPSSPGRHLHQEGPSQPARLGLAGELSRDLATRQCRHQDIKPMSGWQRGWEGGKKGGRTEQWCKMKVGKIDGVRGGVLILGVCGSVWSI